MILQPTTMGQFTLGLCQNIENFLLNRHSDIDQIMVYNAY